ncbi:MAG: PTS transporter subunit EIIC, partial [Clostridium paraputrificum]
QATHLKEIFSFAPAVTTDLLAIYAVFLIAKALSENFELEEKDCTISAIIALLSFLILIPMGVIGTEGEVTVTVAAAIGTKWLGAAGLFSAMVVGLIVPTIYKFIKDKKISELKCQIVFRQLFQKIIFGLVTSFYNSFFILYF